MQTYFYSLVGFFLSILIVLCGHTRKLRTKSRWETGSSTKPILFVQHKSKFFREPEAEQRERTFPNERNDRFRESNTNKVIRQTLPWSSSWSPEEDQGGSTNDTPLNAKQLSYRRSKWGAPTLELSLHEWTILVLGAWGQDPIFLSLPPQL